MGNRKAGAWAVRWGSYDSACGIKEASSIGVEGEPEGRSRGQVAASDDTDRQPSGSAAVDDDECVSAEVFENIQSAVELTLAWVGEGDVLGSDPEVGCGAVASKTAATTAW